MTIKMPSRQRMPGLPGLPNGRRPFQLPEQPALDSPANADEFGLGPWAKDYPRLARQYVARVYEHLHIPKHMTPVEFFGVGKGTVPELVVYGGLLARGFQEGQRSKGFRFQSYELGGRDQPGGAVVDFVVWHGNRQVAVRIDSAFHHGFLGAAKQFYDVEQRRRLLSFGNFDAVIDVNKARHGFPMEHGPDFLIAQEIDEIEAA